MHTILIFSSNGQQQFVSSLVLHLSILSSFAEGRGEIERGIIVFCGTCNNNLTCICGIIMTGGRARGRQGVGERDGIRFTIKWPFATSFLHSLPLQLATCCNAAIPYLMLHSASHCQVGRGRRGTTLPHHQRYQMQTASYSGATSTASTSASASALALLLWLLPAATAKANCTWAILS